MSISEVVTIHRDVDARGLNCPLPILRTKKALNEMASGEVLRVTSTDPHSVKDFAAFCKQTGNSLLQSETESNNFIFVLRRK